MKWLSLGCHLKIERDRSSGDGVEGRRRTKTSRKWTEQQPGAYFGHWSWIWLPLSSLYLAMLGKYSIFSSVLYMKSSTLDQNFHCRFYFGWLPSECTPGEVKGTLQGVLAEQDGGRMSCSQSCHVVSVTQEPVEMSWSQMFCRLCSGCFSSFPKEQGTGQPFCSAQNAVDYRGSDPEEKYQHFHWQKKKSKSKMHIVMWCRACRFIDQFSK